MTAVAAQPVMEYGVHAFYREHARHDVVPCTDLTAALETLADTRLHVDAWAALMIRAVGGEWRRLGPDEGIDALEAHLATLRAVTRG